ncbi:hypothetical protein GW17_00034350 [Ensete ventricosum]|nr:hypothetical protein GW17_00034350 [Ensete ventricosum]
MAPVYQAARITISVRTGIPSSAQYGTVLDIERYAQGGGNNPNPWYHPVAGGPHTGLLVDWYIPPILGGIARNRRPWTICNSNVLPCVFELNWLPGINS